MRRIRMSFASAVVALTALIGPVARPAAAELKPNVILITVDTLRADRLGCYGYTKIETPHIDRLAAEGALFARAFTPVPITLPAHAVLFTGAFPMATGIHDFSGNKLSSSAVTLAEALREQGYSTAAFVASAVLDSRFGLDQGFDTYFDHFDYTSHLVTNLDQLERRGDLVVDEALRWLRLNPRKPIMLWVHLYDPHDPYAPPEPYASRYRDRPYDGEIAFADAQVGRLLDSVKERGLYNNAIVVLTSDHGEGLGEHGELRHGLFIYNSTLHIPLIFRIPGIPPRVIKDDVSLADVMPTLLQTLGIAVPSGVQGRSLLSLISGKRGSGPSELYAESFLPLFHFRWSHLRGIQSRGMKYIEAPRPELYDLRSDPGELNNLIDTHQTIANELRGRLQSLIRRFTPVGGEEAEKGQTDPELLERLRSLGYVSVAAASMAEASGTPLPDPKDRVVVHQLISAAIEDGRDGRYRESLQKLREAEKMEPRSVAVQYLSAINYYRLRDFRNAVSRFQSALDLNPKFALAAYFLGLTHISSGNLDEAVAALSSALENDATNHLASFNLGVTYAKKGLIKEARDEFRRTVQISPGFAQGHAALGEVYLELGHAEEAARSLERAVRLGHESATTHFNLGRAYKALGRTADADREFSLAGRKNDTK